MTSCLPSAANSLSTRYLFSHLVTSYLCTFLPAICAHVCLMQQILCLLGIFSHTLLPAICAHVCLMQQILCLLGFFSHTLLPAICAHPAGPKISHSSVGASAFITCEYHVIRLLCNRPFSTMMSWGKK